jgi:carbon-monoxide dehydrogenase medium subunit
MKLRSSSVVPVFHYPATLDEACALLAEAADPLVYGGGTAVQILLKQGVLFASDLVDIAAVPGLTELRETGAGLRVGALVTLRRMETDPLVRAVAPLAADVYGQVANPRVRNTASVGGNLAHGDYRLDPPTALLVLDAAVELASSAGRRRVPIREFFVDFQRTAVEPGEIITAVEIPRQPAGAGAHFEKLSSLAANDWPCASVAALAVGDQLRLGLGALSHVPVFTQLDVPAGSTAGAAVEAARQAAEPLLDPIPDLRGSAAYKRRLGLVALQTAVEKAWTARKEQPDARTSFRGRRRR